MFQLQQDPNIKPDENSYVEGNFDQVVDVKQFAKWVDGAFPLTGNQLLPTSRWQAT